MIYDFQFQLKLREYISLSLSYTSQLREILLNEAPALDSVGTRSSRTKW